MTWLLVHLVAVAVLAGVGWTVVFVVYPAFRLVGAVEWPAYHRRHLRAITIVVGLPWAVQGVSTAALLLQPAVAGRPATLALAALAAATVVLTWGVAVPAHGRLAQAVDERDLAVLERAHLARTVAWSASTVLAAAVSVATP